MMNTDCTDTQCGDGAEWQHRPSEIKPRNNGGIVAKGGSGGHGGGRGGSGGQRGGGGGSTGGGTGKRGK